MLCINFLRILYSNINENSLQKSYKVIYSSVLENFYMFNKTLVIMF